VQAHDKWLEEGRRPHPENRRFKSSAIERVISDLSPKFSSRNLSRLFTNCFPNTLDTTVNYDPKTNDTFVITGDIYAMWLRDSTNQVLPYVPFARNDSDLQSMICGVIRRQTSLVLIDPYSNAFNHNQSGDGNIDDISKRAGGFKVPWAQRGSIFEQKYELDSLMAVFKLVAAYYEATDDSSCFESFTDSSGQTWLDAVKLILETVTVQQQGTAEEAAKGPPAYTFERKVSVATDTLMQHGHGVPAKRTNMSKCYFRPSDDAVTLPFLVPANAMAVVELRAVSQMLKKLAIKRRPSSVPVAYDGSTKSKHDRGDDYNTTAEAARMLADEINQGIATAAVMNHPKYGEVRDGIGCKWTNSVIAM
jgi:meiotically up-regulated gene 157 (Mug157) protein